jgi:hypothetical protein
MRIVGGPRQCTHDAENGHRRHCSTLRRPPLDHAVARDSPMVSPPRFLQAAEARVDAAARRGLVDSGTRWRPDDAAAARLGSKTRRWTLSSSFLPPLQVCIFADATAC